VRLWRSLHQEATVLDTDGDIDMDGLMLFSLFVGVVAFSLLYVWLLLHRTRGMWMQDLLDDRGLDEALAARRAEGAGVADDVQLESTERASQPAHQKGGAS
ncbi:MAG: hypothetical protein AAGA42_05350, partial [Actinomycetota bacterium]